MKNKQEPKKVLTEEDIFNQKDIDAVTDYINKEQQKQETLEEAAKKYATNHGMMAYVFPEKKESFIEGAKWQQENSNINALDFEIDSLKREIKVLKHQQERMYSEEELLQILESHKDVLEFDGDGFEHDRWFEQFKKK